MLISIPTTASDYFSAKKAAKLLGVTSRRLRLLASQGRVAGAFKHEQKGWLFPKSGISLAPGKRGPAASFSDLPFCNP